MKLINPISFCCLLFLALQSCAPKVSVEPITINLNVKVEHQIKVQVDKELDELFDEDEDLF